MKTTCKRCGSKIQDVDGVWVALDTGTTADGLSFCPPDPDRERVRNHIPWPTISIKVNRSGRMCAHCTDLASHDVDRIPVCDHHIGRAVANINAMRASLVYG